MGKRKGRQLSESSQELIDSIRGDASLLGSCPACAESFRLCDAELSSISALTPSGEEALGKRRQEIAARKAKIAELRARIKLAASGAKYAGVGKVIEKVAPILPGFGHDPRDCRFIGEPIDYLAFRGLSRHMPIEHITFLDIKTSSGRLDPSQRQIRDMVVAQKVAYDLFKP